MTTAQLFAAGSQPGLLDSSSPIKLFVVGVVAIILAAGAHFAERYFDEDSTLSFIFEYGQWILGLGGVAAIATALFGS